MNKPNLAGIFFFILLTSSLTVFSNDYKENVTILSKEEISTDAEWTAIEDLYGGALVSGGKFKETGVVHWPIPNKGADNSSGLTALPGGIRELHGDFMDLANSGYYWTGTENAQANAWYRTLYYWQIIVGQNYSTKKYGMSVKCVKN